MATTRDDIVVQVYKVLANLQKLGIVKIVHCSDDISGMSICVLQNNNDTVVINSNVQTGDINVLSIANFNEFPIIEQKVRDILSDKELLQRLHLASTLSGKKVAHNEEINFANYNVKIDIKEDTKSFPETKSGICVRWSRAAYRKNDPLDYAIRVTFVAK